MFAPTTDADYPQILHLSAALPGLTQEGLVDVERASSACDHAFSLFGAFQAELIAIPCNSLLTLGPALERRYKIPVLTPWACAPAPTEADDIMVLCSSTLREVLATSAVGVRFPSAADQALVQACIETAMAGREDQTPNLQALVAQLITQGAREVRLACTELSCLGISRTKPIVDTLDCLVSACVQRAQSRAVPALSG